MTENRIRAWINEFGADGVYVSFSGGKDSTVLLDIVRNRMGYKNIPAVFVDTGLEYPEIREFVKTFDNVIWLKPKMTFKQVIEKYGYPFVSKEISNCVHGAKHPKNDNGCENSRMLRLKGNLMAANGLKSQYNCGKWEFLLNAPFEIHDKCCEIMKKNPMKNYEEKTKRKPMLAQMAQESRKRTNGWLRTGCNAFATKNPQSNPIAVWTEQDVLQYIKQNNIVICSVYGEIIDIGGKLKLTGCKRTGCMFCGFGCHLEKEGEGRFEKMKITHPKLYDYIMKPKEEGGLDYKNIIDWMNEHGKLSIRY